jgi:hypothetical protein
MKVIALTSTYPADELAEADAVVKQLPDLRIERGDKEASFTVKVSP